jgi:hypothetical protein
MTVTDLALHPLAAAFPALATILPLETFAQPLRLLVLQVLVVPTATAAPRRAGLAVVRIVLILLGTSCGGPFASLAAALPHGLRSAIVPELVRDILWRGPMSSYDNMYTALLNTPPPHVNKKRVNKK